MDKPTWAKNFAMCKEVEIAGKFIYDGMIDLNRMINYEDDENIFCFLYKISVGIERLQKIAYTLLKNPTENEYENFEKELITHSHCELQRKINELVKTDFTKHQNAFLQMLDTFYKSSRYDRYILNTKLNYERNIFIKYIEKRCKIKIEVNSIFPTQMDEKIRKFLGKVIGNMSQYYYNLIYKQAINLDIYSYELSSNSKSYKIFELKNEKKNIQQQFTDEQIAYKELLVFLINTSEKSKFYTFLKEIHPLNLDIALIQEHLYEIIKSNISQDLIEEIETLYSEMDKTDLNNRLEQLRCIGNPSINFEYEDYDNDY